MGVVLFGSLELTQIEVKILILLLFPVFAVAQDYDCVEYDIHIDRTIVTSDSVCYVSPLETRKKKYILTISTDRYHTRFAVLQSFPIASEIYEGTLTFAVVVGEPNQLYVIREERGDSRYFFSVRPIRQYSKVFKIISGRVLEVTNIK